MTNFTIHHGDCKDVLAKMSTNSIDAIVTDPPYGLSDEPDPVAVMRAWVNNEAYHHKKKGFMGHEWDAFVPQPEYWKEALRVLKPGGYAIVFAGSRTQDWMTMSLRFAGFEIVDTLMWVHSQGMPKSLDISKAIDKHCGATRPVIGQREDILKKQNADLQRGTRKIVDSLNSGNAERNNGYVTVSADVTAPVTDEALRFSGFGTQLKPAYEPIILCRKPFKGTFAGNVLKHGVGGINIDACRVPIDEVADASQVRVINRSPRAEINGQKWGLDKDAGGKGQVVRQDGRFPANFIHDGSDAVVALFPDNKGSAARFFYCAKPSTRERHLGMDFPGATTSHGTTKRAIESMEKSGNHHPTVKPLALMRWLCRLVCPPGGKILDLYCGSGSTGMAAVLEGFTFDGVERDKDYAAIAQARIEWAQKQSESQ